MKPTLKQYFKAFAGLRSLFAAVPFVLPLIRAGLSNSNGVPDYLYPPLGDAQSLAIAATLGFLLLTLFVVFEICHMSSKIHASAHVILAITAAFGFCTLLAFYVFFVRKVPVPAIGKDVLVSVGYQRTDYANKNYPQDSDWEMLHSQGPREESVHRLWTESSIAIVRASLWLFYTLVLMLFLASISLGAYRCAAGQTPRRR
jgi:hypothetical protein